MYGCTAHRSTNASCQTLLLQLSSVQILILHSSKCLVNQPDIDLHLREPLESILDAGTKVLSLDQRWAFWVFFTEIKHQKGTERHRNIQKTIANAINRSRRTKRFYSAGLGLLKTACAWTTPTRHITFYFFTQARRAFHWLKMLCHPCTSLLLTSIIARCSDVQIRSLGGCYFGRCTKAHDLYS